MLILQENIIASQLSKVLGLGRPANMTQVSPEFWCSTSDLISPMTAKLLLRKRGSLLVVDPVSTDKLS